VLRILRAEGWYCSRSAASHGPVDVFAAKDGEVRMIQVKSGRARLRAGDRETLRRWAHAYAGIAEVWYFRNRTGIIKEIVFDARSKS